MLFTDSVFVGIDPTSGRKSYTYAVLDRGLSVVALADAEIEEVVAFLGGQRSATVAINAPSQVNRGLVRKQLEEQSLTPGHQFRGVDVRVAEHQLRGRGIAVSATGARESLCPAWVQAGFELYKKLLKLGFESYPSDCSYQWLETHPHACFCVLQDGNLMSKPTLEGRLQRQLILYEREIQIKDPMVFFEEITRHKLAKGILPMDFVYLPEQLDALVAAYTAWVAVEKPAEVTRIGHEQEGFITLPVASLKEKY